jgi:hypothetical protein
MAFPLDSAAVWALLGGGAAMVLRGFFDSGLKAQFNGFEKRVEQSLAIKTGLREEEQKALADLRVALSDWEDHLTFGIGVIMNQPDFEPFEPDDFYKRDRGFYAAVRKTAARASVYLRSEQLGLDIEQTISTIWAAYQPLVNKALTDCIDPQAPVRLILLRLRKFEDSAGEDMRFAPSEADRAVLQQANMRTTEILMHFFQAVVAAYPEIGEKVVNLRFAINDHVYRQMNSNDIDEMAEEVPGAHKSWAARLLGWFRI